jgi:hypothetical protein
METPMKFPISIPTSQSFLKQWHNWTHAQVAKRWKRDKDRIPDVVQNVRIRLLSKDIIGRWFYKHLTDEYVDRSQAEYILYSGCPDDRRFKNLICEELIRPHSDRSWQTRLQFDILAKNRIQSYLNHSQSKGGIVFNDSLKPVFGDRTDPNSIWKISDILEVSNFNYERYYYSIQNHTINTASILYLLGYGPKGMSMKDATKDSNTEWCISHFGSLQSLYRQGRMLPSEMTEHECFKSPDCPMCKSGRLSLKLKKLSLAHDWKDPSITNQILKLRWNDGQLKPFLRDWKKSNKIKTTPLYIMRDSAVQGIEAGLLKYALIMIDNAVKNEFKSLGRTDDLGFSVLNNGVSPETMDSDSIVWEKDEDSESSLIRTFVDIQSTQAFSNSEVRQDISKIIRLARLTDQEVDAIIGIDLSESTVRIYADKNNLSMQYVREIRSSAIKKIKGVTVGSSLDLHIPE